jgi:hypothetical protein
MAVPSSGVIKISDVFLEIYGRLPNVNGSDLMSLEGLVNASYLQDKERMHDLGMFYGYVHTPPCTAYGTYSHTYCDDTTDYYSTDVYHDGSCGYYEIRNGMRCGIFG